MKFYYVTVEDVKGFLGANVIVINNNENLLSYARNKNLVILHPVRTLKEAQELCDSWNDSYKRQNRLLFDVMF